VIGPTRMDYSVVVPLVRATADALASAITRADQRAAGSPEASDPFGTADVPSRSRRPHQN